VKLGILVPTLNRPESIEPLASNIADTTPVGLYSLIFVLDYADHESREAVRRAEFSRFILCDGTYPRKTNSGYLASNDEFILPTADDVWFRPGWSEAVLAEFENPNVQVVGTDDTTPATADRTHATMPVIRRSYIEHPGCVWGLPGVVFRPEFHHNFVENEVWQLAAHRGVTAWSDAVIEHRHPDWGTRELDATDEKGNRQGWDRDRATFEARKAEWSRS
jgi:glycosyltransferase involved in cell wall biosynthesis